MIFLEHENNPKVLEDEFNSKQEEKRRKEREEKERIIAEAKRKAEEEEAANLSRKGSSLVNQKQKDEDSLIYTNELLHKLEVLNDQEDESRHQNILRFEEKHYQEAL